MIHLPCKCFRIRSHNFTHNSPKSFHSHPHTHKMATIAAEMMFRCFNDCSLSLDDFDIERRPYHKNCGCALHKLQGVCYCASNNSISFSKKKSWPDFSLSLSSTTVASSSSSVSINFSSQPSRSA